MTDIDWPSLRAQARQRLLELLPALRRPALTRGEVLALGDGWASAVRNPQYWPARDEAFSTQDTGGRFRTGAWEMAWLRARASNEWRGDLLNHACNAIRDAALGRFTADWIKPASAAILERVWREVMEEDSKRPADLVLGSESSPRNLDLTRSFVSRCQGRGFDEKYARALEASPAYEFLGPRRLAYDAALRRCREATWAGGRDNLARETAQAATRIPTPGRCWPDEMTILADEFLGDLARTAEAVVARDLLDPEDFAILTETWRSHLGSLG
jgi:hypothetical protein